MDQCWWRDPCRFHLNEGTLKDSKLWAREIVCENSSYMRDLQNQKVPIQERSMRQIPITGSVAPRKLWMQRLLDSCRQLSYRFPGQVATGGVFVALPVAFSVRLHISSPLHSNSRSLERNHWGQAGCVRFQENCHHDLKTHRSSSRATSGRSVTGNSWTTTDYE